MKKLLFAIFIFTTINIFGQKPCEISTDVKDSIGTYKTTKDYLVFESNFSTTKEYVYFYLANTDGTPTLNVQFINKSAGFIKAKCLDKDFLDDVFNESREKYTISNLHMKLFKKVRDELLN